MGTWAAGPFGNDAAMDWMGDVIDHLMKAIDAFLEEPEIDETFDEAFAAVAILNEVMTRTVSRPWDLDAGAVRDPAPIVAALIACYDEQIDGMRPDEDFKRDQRSALMAECERFTTLLAD